MIARLHRNDGGPWLYLMHPAGGRVWILDVVGARWLCALRPQDEPPPFGCDPVHLWLPGHGFVASYVHVPMLVPRLVGGAVGPMHELNLLAPPEWMAMDDPYGASLRAAWQQLHDARLRRLNIDFSVRAY